MPFNICRISIFSAISIWLDHTVTKLYLLYAVEALSIAPGLVAEGKVLKNGKELSFAGKVGEEDQCTCVEIYFLSKFGSSGW